MENSETAMAASLVKRARTGDPDAFSELVRIYSPRLYWISFRILKNREDAEDNLQNAFCKAFRGIKEFEGLASVFTWLARIAVNEALMKIRQNRSSRTVGYLDPTIDEEVEKKLSRFSDSTADPERRCTTTDLATKAFVGVEPKLAHAFLLTKVQGLTNRELAKALGTTPANVKSRVFRARCKLRQHLNSLSQNPPAARPYAFQKAGAKRKVRPKQ
jgi:RNA polymerase sigma-70 factor (ECF subfamily)